MNPMVRIWLLLGAMAGILLVGRAMWPLVTGNLAARNSWTRTEGEVRAMSGAVEFEIGSEPSSYRAFAQVDHTWGLSLFKKAPLFIDPADPTRVKTAGLLQMWLAPAEMAGLLILLLAAVWLAASLGTVPSSASTPGSWQFVPSPGPRIDGIRLYSPSRQWKIVVGWSMLGVGMVVLVAIGKDNRQASRLAYMLLGSAFAIGLWMYAWHTKSLELSANGQGLRMTSALGWRDVPWEMVRGVELQEIFTTYYNGNMRMWELPFPGSTARVYSFNDQRGRTLLSFSPELAPKDGLKQLFDLCAQRTGSKLQHRTIRTPF
ncbi:MAG: hypothetical protein JWP63_747 [Candidatus Solibacter sp.]|nr:hypothetical protein [Candidatus Solibacter sp.]